MTVETEALRAAISNAPPPFELRKIGHVVLMVTDLKRSIAFYTGVLGFKVSDIYGEDMMPGGMVFMRLNPDHHGVALIGGAPGPSQTHELHHMAFEVGSLDEVFRARKHLRESGATIVFDGRRRAGVQIAVEFRDPDGHRLEIYWGLDRVAADGYVRPASEWKLARSLKDAVADPVVGQDTTLNNPTAIDEAVADAAAREAGGTSRWR